MSLRNLNFSVGGKRIFGTPKTGVIGLLIPSSGDSGPAFAYPSLSLPADNYTEISGWITEWPTGGMLTAYEDTSFTFSAPDGYYTFKVQIKANGVDVGSPVTISLLIGSGIHPSSGSLVADSASLQGACVRASAVLTLTAADINAIAAAVLAALQASAVPFPANVKKVNDLTVVGQGLAPPNHWRPA